MGLLLDKCCCSNDTKIREFEDFVPPEVMKVQPTPIHGLDHY